MYRLLGRLFVARSLQVDQFQYSSTDSQSLVRSSTVLETYSRRAKQKSDVCGEAAVWAIAIAAIRMIGGSGHLLRIHHESKLRSSVVVVLGSCEHGTAVATAIQPRENHRRTPSAVGAAR